MNDKGTFGRKGENAAAEYLIRQGYNIIERNYRCKYGEIDIIAEKEKQISFVEVKTRHNLAYGTPGMAVNYTKQKKIRSTALHYLQQVDTYYVQISFDVIEIIVNNDKAQLRHLKQCF